MAYVLKDRKMCLEPVEIVRRCICKIQGRKLCGVCVLKRRYRSGLIFPDLTYNSTLAFLKLAARVLDLHDAQYWGTHAFRRGWASDALKEGGPNALFYSGGWRGVAALGYAQAQTRGAISAAEWLVDHSDSSDSDNELD